MPRPIVLAGLLLACVLGAGCADEAPPAAGVTGEAPSSASQEDFVSAPAPAAPVDYDVRGSSDWPAARVTSGTARVTCDAGDGAQGEGAGLVNLEYFSVLDAMSGCREAGVLRLRYEGRIADDFAQMMVRVSEMAGRMDIGKRILDIDSAGGQVESAIAAGDAIADSGWTILVRGDSVCHSACVLVLAAGDVRTISGKVGVHRIIRLGSKATTRQALSLELEAVQAQIEAYLERNGASVDVAEMMMTVPNRGLRLLDAGELQAYGLSGTNAIQDDLERIRLAQQCGEAFVHRRDAFVREFERACAAAGRASDAINACGLEMRGKFGFPDRRCPMQSPLSELDAPDQQ